MVGFDPLFVGESIDPAAPVAHRPETVHFETYNPSLAADQIQDLATVLSWARSQADVREVSLVGLGLAGPQVLLARPLLEGLARTVVDLVRLARLRWLGRRSPLPLTCRACSSSEDSRPPPPFLLLPHSGFTAPGRHLHEPGPRAAYELAGSSHTLRFSSGEIAPEALARWIDRGE